MSGCRITLVFLLVLACDDGAGSGASDARPGPDGAADVALDGRVADVGVPGPPDRLACPTPEGLPFTPETTGFEGDENRAVAALPGLRYGAQDLLGDPSGEAFRGLMARGRALVDTPFVGAAVSLWRSEGPGLWRSLGRIQTDDAGAYELAVATGERFEQGIDAVYAVLEGDGSCARHGIFFWPPGSQIVVTDIDGTLTASDAEFATQLGDETHDPQAMGSAVELMDAWAEKGYRLVYMTARAHGHRGLTRAWLAGHGFPDGALITADGLLFGAPARRYKAEALGRVIGALGWEVIAAYGNAESDIGGYEDAGVDKARTFMIHLGRTDPAGTVVIEGDDYAPHVESYVRQQPEAAQP